MSESKFCIDCVHYKLVEPFGRFGGPVFVECRHPRAPRDLVHGIHATCTDQRGDVLQCGPDGTRWQRKPVDKPQPKPERGRWWWPW